MAVGTRSSDEDRMLIFSLSEAGAINFSGASHQTRIAISNGEPTSLSLDASHYIVVHSGEFLVTLDGNTYRLKEGCFGSFPGATRLQGDGQALILSSIGYRCTTLVGGPVEEFGRLRYVDGCTSSLLLSPSVRGEPCLNFLHIPGGISQTMHTHPSLRAGLILSGTGRCDTQHGPLDFRPGTAFVIPPIFIDAMIGRTAAEQQQATLDAVPGKDRLVCVVLFGDEATIRPLIKSFSVYKASDAAPLASAEPTP